MCAQNPLRMKPNENVKKRRARLQSINKWQLKHEMYEKTDRYGLHKLMKKKQCGQTKCSKFKYFTLLGSVGFFFFFLHSVERRMQSKSESKANKLGALEEDEWGRDPTMQIYMHCAYMHLLLPEGVAVLVSCGNSSIPN